MESGVESQINYLLNNNLIEQISNKKLKVKGKGRIYNPSKPPNENPTKIVGSLYKKQFPKEPKPTRRIRNVKDKPAGSADVLLKFNEFSRVDKDIFLDFELEYRYSQINKENAQTIALRFIAVIESIEIDPDTGEQIGDAKIHTIEKFIEQEIVYGGEQGLKLYIKYETLQLVNRLEDSGTYI